MKKIIGGFAYLILHNGEADVLQHKCTTTSGLLKFSMSQDSAISNVKWSKKRYDNCKTLTPLRPVISKVMIQKDRWFWSVVQPSEVRLQSRWRGRSVQPPQKQN